MEIIGTWLSDHEARIEFTFYNENVIKGRCNFEFITRNILNFYGLCEKETSENLRFTLFLENQEEKNHNIFVGFYGCLKQSTEKLDVIVGWRDFINDFEETRSMSFSKVMSDLHNLSTVSLLSSSSMVVESDDTRTLRSS